MQRAEVLSRPSRRPDAVVRYGDDAERVADVRLPKPGGAGERTPGGEPLPLVLLLHGGFWRSAHDRAHLGPLADALADNGFVVCTPEYRRIGQPGGGWPGTFDDAAAALEVLPGLLGESAVGRADVSRVILAGHSAGGHLAVCAAAQRDAADGRRLAIVSLAGVCDLTRCYRDGLDDDAAGDLMGGSPEAFPDRYGVADPMRLVPIGAPIILLHGTADERVPWEYSRDFATRARAGGDDVDLTLIPQCGHFELIDPVSSAWSTVLGAFRAAAVRLGQT